MTHTTAVDVDALLAEILLTPEGKADPYPRYAAIREAGPAHRTALDFVVVGRYEDCQGLLRDPRFGKGQPGPIWEFYDLTEEQWQDRFGAFTKQTRSMLGLDPPDHTRLRRLVAKAFTPKTVENLRPDIERLTDELFDACGTEVDVIPQLALPLPMNVISEMVGIPVDHRTELQPLIRASVVTLEINPSLDQLEAASVAIGQVAEIVEDLIVERRARPTDDLLSELIHVEEQGDQLSHEELISTVMLIFGAGFETTTNLIGNGLLALLDHPDQLQRLRDDASLVPSAVEELLRWDSPVQVDGRKALEPAEIHGIALEPGEEFVTLLGGANRDPRAFPDPERFDVGRSGHQPMSFGAGIHFCLGAALARAEGRVFFERLLSRYTAVEPAWSDRPRYRDSVVLRGLESLPVTLSPN
jgi:cytochrome P450